MSLVLVNPGTAGSALGSGRFYPIGSLSDRVLAERVAGYKRGIASRYRAVTAEEATVMLPPGQLFVSPKIDGEIWCLVAEPGQVALVAYNGRVIQGDVPLLKELASTVGARVKSRVIIAGELYAATKAGRPRVGDVASALSGGTEADANKLGFQAFDVLEGPEGAPGPEYAPRLALLQQWFEGGKRGKVVRTESTTERHQIPAWFAEWVEKGSAEGLVVRTEDGRIFKIKPQFTLDAAIIGYTESSDTPDSVRSFLFALLRPDGAWHLVGSCGAVGDSELRKSLYQRLVPTVVPSEYRHASSSGEIFRFVRPSIVVEIRVTDLQAEDSKGGPVTRMVLRFDDNGGWRPLRPMPGVAPLYPVLVRFREDKGINAVDVRAAQIAERVMVDNLDAATTAVELPRSETLRREVYTKDTKGEVAVRKLLVWRTHKEKMDPAFPAYVVHWTDYSPGRKEPLQREVRPAPDEASAMSVADGLIAENIKKGWVRAN